MKPQGPCQEDASLDEDRKGSRQKGRSQFVENHLIARVNLKAGTLETSGIP